MGIQVDSLDRSSSVSVGKPEDWLIGGGEMGKLIRSMDWAKTPLGPIESWPQSLRTTVSLCFASKFPISLAWGPNHVQIYNDGYWPICGGKHPHSMGQDFTQCWASAWPVIGDAFERACAGEPSYLEDQRIFIDRNGYLEETFFTFSFSPIRDETGAIGGLFHPLTETTSRMLSERRTRGLRDLATRTSKAGTMDEACRLTVEALAEYELDLPFALFYVYDALGKEARLTASTGIKVGMSASPEIVNLEHSQPSGWPWMEFAHARQSQLFSDLETRFGQLSVGPYPESPKQALALPIIPPGCENPVGLLIAGVSSRLPLTETYRAFYELTAVAITAAVANSRAREAEIKRTQALAEIDRAKTAFFSNISHEFRTPLTLMLGPLEDELAERTDPLPAERRERLEAAHRNSLRLLKLVNTLLDFSRIEAGRVQAKYQPTDLAAYTAELAGIFRSAIEKAGLVLAIDCPALPELIYVDQEMWEKIVLNLLSNALKHTFEGCISVKLSWCGDHVKLVVADSGIGIPEAALPRLFERFHRVEGARSRSNEGTGIGLALVREFVSFHGGTVGVESQENKGSTFTVTLKAGTAHLPSERVSAKYDLTTTAAQTAAPYVVEALQWLRNASSQSDSYRGSEVVDVEVPHNGAKAVSGTRRARILWADDNADMRDYVRRLLAGNYDVLAVPDGLSALARCRQEVPDLVLSDIMMPGLDGYGLLRELRNDPGTRNVPVILLSARAGEEAAVEGLNAGADDYLVKPFSAKELLARLRTHLALARTRREWADEVGALNADLERRVSQRTAELAASEEQLRLLVSGVKDYAIFMLDPDGRTLTWNLGCQRLYGWSAEEIIGQHFSRFYPQQEIADHLPQRELDIAGAEGHFAGEGWRIRKDGSRFWVNVIITPIVHDDGHLVGFSKVTRDTTERRRIEQAMKEEEARLAAVIGSAMDAVITVDENHRVTLFNPAAEKMFGYSAELALGRPLDQLIPERFRTDHASHIQMFTRTNVSRRKMGALSPIYGLRSNGEEFPIEASISQAHIAGQTILSVILRDISERNRSEELLRQQASLLDVAPVLVRDLEDRIVFWSSGLARLYSFSRREAEGRISHELLHTQFPEPLKQIQEKLDSTGIWEGELHHRDRDGNQVIVNSQWVLYRDSHGTPARILELNADITAKKRAESLQLRSQKLESLGTLSGGIAHDFNNILMAITGNTELAIADLPPEHPARQSLAEIDKAVTRATDLVHRILTFSRPSETKRQIIHLQPPVEEALKLVRATLPASIKFCTSFAPNPPTILADSTQVHQVVVNLATNAAHAIGPRTDGVIEIHLETANLIAADPRSSLNLPDGAYIRLRVADNGCGMDRAILDRIFDPFFTTKAPGEGTGLGLAVVHGIMKNHDGGIAVRSEPGAGTEFQLFFPSAGQPVAAVEDLPAASRERQHTENILYVDDEEALVHLITRTLGRLGYKVTGETNPVRAVELFRSNPKAYDVVVTDLTMPQLSGFDLSAQLLAIRPEVPIIMTTGFVRPEDQERAMHMGLRELILKSNTIKQLGGVLDRIFFHELS